MAASTLKMHEITSILSSLKLNNAFHRKKMAAPNRELVLHGERLTLFCKSTKRLKSSLLLHLEEQGNVIGDGGSGGETDGAVGGGGGGSSGADGVSDEHRLIVFNKPQKRKFYFFFFNDAFTFAKRKKQNLFQLKKKINLPRANSSDALLAHGGAAGGGAGGGGGGGGGGDGECDDNVEQSNYALSPFELFPLALLWLKESPSYDIVSSAAERQGKAKRKGERERESEQWRVEMYIVE